MLSAAIATGFMDTLNLLRQESVHSRYWNSFSPSKPDNHYVSP